MSKEQENSETQKVRLTSKHPTFVGDKSFTQGYENYVSFAVGSDYKLLETIGAGAYGVVCSAIDTKTGQHVAIKKIVNPFEVLTTAKRTLRELKLLLHFKHENIVGIRNIIQSNRNNVSDVYLVMDLMESDLHHIIRSDQLLSAEHVRYFLYQLLRGLKYIHSANVIHRDLKPSNLLVNENCELKIGDFGMARAVSGKAEDHKLFMTEYVATRWYRAPELMLSIGDYSQSIDIWSVGCIFAEMIGRKQIFPGRHYVHQLQLVISVLGSPAKDVVQSIRSDRVRSYVKSLPHRDPVQMKALYPKASGQMLDLLQSLLQFDPSKRPTSDQALFHSFFTGYHDADDEPICQAPFDFQFESTVTKEEVFQQVNDVINKYRERKNRLSKQLLRISNAAINSPTQQPGSAAAITSEDEGSIANDTSTVSTRANSDSVSGFSVFKKPTAPSQPPKIPQKPVASQSLLKPPLDDIDMKSANSVCSMDLSLEMDGKVTKLREFYESAIKSSNSTVDTGKREKVPPVPKPLITVQVVQDDVVDLTADDDPKRQKQKKQGDKNSSKKSQATSNAQKKTTVSENTKMKIRDSIFANMLSKQKGLGKPLEKVKKSVTAAERQREREEKRKKRQERAAEKERKREEEARKKNELSEDDKNLLDRWMKMQSKSGTSVDELNASTCKKPERISSTKSETEDKPVLPKVVERHRSLPTQMARTYQQAKQPNSLEVHDGNPSINDEITTHGLAKATENCSITVSSDGNSTAAANTTLPTRRLATPETYVDNSGRTPAVQYIFSDNGALVDAQNDAAVPHYPSMYTKAAPLLQQENGIPSNMQYASARPNFIAQNHFRFRPSQDVPLTTHDVRKLDQYPTTTTTNGSRNVFTGAEGGLFIPENGCSHSGPEQNVNQLNSDPQRPSSLFADENDPKIRVLVGSELMTPGKILQHSSMLTTPQGRNLATLSPDTVDSFLNEEFSKCTAAEMSRDHLKQIPVSNRPASYPSMVNTSLQEPPLYNALPDVVESSTRSKSFTYLTTTEQPNVNVQQREHLSMIKQHSLFRNEVTSGTSGSLGNNSFKPMQGVLSEKKSDVESTFDFSPNAFIRSLDDGVPYSVERASEPPAVPSHHLNGGIFVPLADDTSAIGNTQQVSLSDTIPSAGAASAIGYGLGVDIADIIPQSAGDGGLSMDFAASADHSDSSLLADWLDVSCLQPQDMEALQRELELGSPMSVDGS